MLYIDSTSKEIIDAKNKHLVFFRCRIIKKLTGAHCLDKGCEVCNSTNQYVFASVKSIADLMIFFILDKDNLDNILSGSPQNLFNLNQAFLNHVLPQVEINKIPIYLTLTNDQKKAINYKTILSFFKDINALFNYNWFIGLKSTENYSAYSLAKNLNRRSCTYCNREYTTTMKTRDGGKLMRPQFDHWFPKSKYPLLAISFFNLIPSCYTCNSSVKGDMVLNLHDHVHPYIDTNQTNEFFFNYFYSSVLDKYRIFIQLKNTQERKALNTFKALKIDEMYNSHHEELKDLIKIKYTYSETYIRKIQDLFPKNSLPTYEVYRLLFGTEIDSVDFHKRPLSKFKHDILKKLGIIDY